MLELIPINEYTNYFYYLIWVFIGVILIHTLTLTGREKIAINFNNRFSIVVLVLIILYIGLRPIHGIFVDMKMYEYLFELYKAGEEVRSSKELGFQYFTKLLSKVLNSQLFFLVCAIIYVLPVYLAFKKWYKNYYLYAFVLFIASLLFWAYGTNTIRAGMASSMVIYGISLHNRKVFMLLIFALALTFQRSMLLPILAFGLTFYNSNTKLYVIVWLGAIGLSLLFGNYWALLFSKIGYASDKLTVYLLAEKQIGLFRYSGFRWDFLLYSFIPVLAGYYFIFIKQFNDVLYKQIFHTYLVANSFWVLVIRANYSDRFAHLSWFLMAIIFSYPLLKQVFWKHQFAKIGLITVVYFSFTYVLNMFLV